MKRRTAAWCAAGLLAAAAGCGGHALIQPRPSDDVRDADVAVTASAKAVRLRPDDAGARDALSLATRRASASHLDRGRRLAAERRDDEAEIDFQIASELDRANADAVRALQSLRISRRAHLDAADTAREDAGPGIGHTQNAAPPAGEVTRQFVLRNASVKNAVDTLRIVADARDIAPVNGANAFVVRDSPDRMRVIADVVNALDKARPEVAVDVNVLAVNRDLLEEYARQIAESGGAGLNVSAALGRSNGASQRARRQILDANVLMTNIPTLYDRLLQTDAATRVLVDERLSITDGTAANVILGQDIAIARPGIGRAAPDDSAPAADPPADHRIIGVTLRITPRVHPDDAVTIALEAELTSLGAPEFGGFPTFGRRNVSTSLQLQDGETTMLAGFIRANETADTAKIPGLGVVPVLGHLFALGRRGADRNTVIILLTPHITRVLDLAPADLRPLLLPRPASSSNE